MPKKRLLLNNRLAVPTMIVAVALATSACTKKEQPVSQPPAAAKPAPTPAVKPVQTQLSSAKPSGSVSPQLDFTSKKDPFKPFITQPAPVPKGPQRAVSGREKSAGELLPIQSYDVTKFKVSGIVANLKENRALIIDPAGKGYVVKQGMLIGNNNGYISKITPSYIEVVETYREDTGKQRKRTVKLTLPQKK